MASGNHGQHPDDTSHPLHRILHDRAGRISRMFESVARQAPSRKKNVDKSPIPCLLSIRLSSLSFYGPHMTPRRCVAQKSLARRHTTHRIPSSHRHTEILLRLQHIGEDQYSWRSSGEAVQRNALLCHPLTPAILDISSPTPATAQAWLLDLARVKG